MLSETVKKTQFLLEKKQSKYENVLVTLTEDSFVLMKKFWCNNFKI